VKDLPSFHANAITILISGILTLKDVLIRVETIPPLSHKFLGSILLILTTSAVIVFSNRNPSGEPTNIISRSLPILSKMTYPIYLLHFEVGFSLIYLSIKIGLTSKEAFLASFVGIMIISFLLVKIIEPRCNKYIRKYLLNFESK
jgi:peptidoglycan/LPS O-acetylase OafA/YrhL